MRKSKLLGLSIIIALAVSLISPAVASAELEQKTRVGGGGINLGEEANALAIVPTSIEYVEGLNDNETVDDARYYGADWFGIEYTPTVSYNLKKVELMAGEGTGEYIVQLRPDSDGMPSDTILRETSFTQVDTVSWQGAEFAESYPVTAGITYWIVFRPVAGSQASVAQSGTLITYFYDYGGDGWDGSDSEPWMAKFYKEVQEFQYHFRLNPFINVIHMNTNPGGWLNGLFEGAGYMVPLLGKYEGGMAYIAIDLPPGGIEMAFVAITIATRDGYMYRITDNLTLFGPDYVWLTPVTERSMEGPTLDEDVGSQVTPQAWYTFQVNPWINIYHLNTDLAPWLWGYSEPEPFDPILGYSSGGRFFLATDFIPDGGGGLELSFKAGTIASRDGYSIRTADGISYIGPDYFWLTPV